MTVVLPDRVLGVDWSGAIDAGRRIWIASGECQHGCLKITELFRAADLSASVKGRAQSIAAVADWIARLKYCVIGMDFPFSLPLPLIKANSWETFVLSFAERFRDPEDFRAWCTEQGKGKELKRRTDELAKTPFSPYNLRLFRQTYWGIAGVLAPLVTTKSAVILPMQAPRRGLPWLLETCPASLLKRLDQYVSYKGPDSRHRKGRRRIVTSIQRDESLRFADSWIIKKVLADTGGDALDAVLAALAAFKALHRPEFPYPDWHKDFALEALVYM